MLYIALTFGPIRTGTSASLRCRLGRDESQWGKAIQHGQACRNRCENGHECLKIHMLQTTACLDASSHVFCRVIATQKLDFFALERLIKVPILLRSCSCRGCLLEAGSHVILHIFELACVQIHLSSYPTASSVKRIIPLPQPYFFSSPSLTSENSVSCALHSSLYKPPRSISFSCVPDSATLPSLRTMMTSESYIVRSLCATNTEVRFFSLTSELM
jgi:hypothetical protein